MNSQQQCFAQIFQSSCNPATFVVDTVGANINWTQFPDFTLPFTIIYHGKVPDDSLLHMLKKGFSHVATSDLDYKDTLFPDQRAYTWTGIVNADSWGSQTGQPWWLIKSPWNNDIAGYRSKWMDRLNNIKSNRYKYNPPSGKWIDIVIADLEWSLHLPSGILSIKNDSLVPPYYQSLPNAAFVAEYRKAMVDLYAEPLRLAEDSFGLQNILSSYAETPIRRTWTGIDDYTWAQWTSDSTLVDFLMHDSTGFMSSEFYEKHAFICPSIYNFYNVTSPNPIARKYLGYNMFMMEANMAWSTKGQLVYCWTNYHPATSNQEPYAPWQAEATAIFPLMNGAIGLYHWVPTRYDVYEYYIYGLYRLSQYAGMFDGNQVYVRPEPGYASFMNMTPVWRGLVNGNNILIAAQNPFAAAGDTTVITVAYHNWSQDIALIGNETFLCMFQMNITEVADHQQETSAINLTVQPNPAGGEAQVQIENPEAGIISLQLFNMMGAYVSTLYNGHLEKGMHHLNLNIATLDAGIYLLKMQIGEMERVVRVVLVN